MPPRLRPNLSGGWASACVALLVGVAVALLLVPGSDRARAPKGAPTTAAAVTAPPNHPSARVKEVLRTAKATKALRNRLRARLRASARRVPRLELRISPPSWAKQRRPQVTDRLVSRVNPIESTALAGVPALASTLAVGDPTAEEPAAGEAASPAAVDQLVSDEFNEPALDTSVWTFVNPLGDVGLSMTGTHAELSMAAGIRHDLWTNTDEVPRLIQAAPNTDFEVELRWDSTPTEGYQLQGILVQQDADDMLRIETHHDGGSPKLFVARLAGGSASVLHFSSLSGSAPTYMRLQREGSSWTIRTSSNGTSWTTAATFSDNIAVIGIGPFAGNSSGGWAPPAFTSRIDYFRALSSVPADATPPVISGVSATPSGVGAEVRWQTDEPATSSVAYGTDTTYSGGTVGRQAQVTDHAVTLSGLACGQLYHYQVRSRDAQANEAVSADRTFTTEPCPATIGSDEFNGASLNKNLWTFVDPIGDVGLSFTGSQAQLSLPQGRRHDLWSHSDEVPKLLQAAPNTNFEVEAKWDTAPTDGFHLQGIIVQQDADDMLRIETHHDGGSQRLFVARVAAGEASVVRNVAFQGPAPVYFRLKREGNLWTLRTSQDGESWTTSATFTESLTVTAIGPFAGNSGWTPPSFTSRIDYFRDVPPDLTPPVASGIDAEPTGAAGRISWSTNEPATSEVRYGRTTGYEGGTLARPDLVRQHSVSLHGLACDTLYHFQIRGADAAGNRGTSPDRTFTTAPCPEFLQSDEFSGETLDSKWTFVDPVGDSSMQVTGGSARLTLPAGSRHDLWTGADEVPRLLQAAPDADFEVEAKFDSQVTTAYQMQGIVVEQDINDLLRIETHHDGGNTYFFVASIVDGVASPIVARQIPASPSFWLRVSRVGDRWTVRFSHDGDAFSLGASFDRPMTVAAVGPYAGNSGSTPPAFQSRVDYFREITDRTPPSLTAISARPRSRSAVLTWTSDEPAGSVVEYAESGGTWVEGGSAKLETRHYVVLPGLACARTYTYRVRSADALGNQTVSSERSFSSAPCTVAGGPDIELWNGDNQTFGRLGTPQTWVNVVGNVSDPDGVASLSATLNGGPPQQLGIGPDGWRLERPGDFNVELHEAELFPGRNRVELRAVDGAGNVELRTLTVNWEGRGGGPAPPANGPVLIVAAHPDDETLGTAGIIRRAREAGRRVVAVIATNGEGSRTASSSGECGAPGSPEERAAAYGLLRDREAREAVGVLGLNWSSNLMQTELIFLGYDGGGLRATARADMPRTDDITGLHRTYAEDFDGDEATCNGDFRYLLSGEHSSLSASAIAADLDALLDMVDPSDVYTHAHFDGHPDHAEVYRQVVAAVRRTNTSARVHTTIMHPEGDESCMQLSAARWPNPPLMDNDPFARFTPWLDVTAPPARPCDPASAETRWGPLGPPNELVEVPASMQEPLESANQKWRAISEHESQVDCTNPDAYHVTCGYMRAFVKRHEFFWTYDYRERRDWPVPFEANWSSDQSISELAQILEGEWRYEGNGVRPLATGFDRALVLGDMEWTNYEVRVPITVHSSDSTRPHFGAGLALGWQGHTAWDQPRKGHPTGGLCLYSRGSNGSTQLQIGYSPGPVHDTTVAQRELPLTEGIPYIFRFRQEAGPPGTTRYSCKVWRADRAEPSEWTLTADIPLWPGETSQHPGSAVLLAHEVDATFGDVRVSPVAP